MNEDDGIQNDVHLTPSSTRRVATTPPNAPSRVHVDATRLSDDPFELNPSNKVNNEGRLAIRGGGTHYFIIEGDNILVNPAKALDVLPEKVKDLNSPGGWKGIHVTVPDQIGILRGKSKKADIEEEAIEAFVIVDTIPEVGISVPCSILQKFQEAKSSVELEEDTEKGKYFDDCIKKCIAQHNSRATLDKTTQNGKGWTKVKCTEEEAREIVRSGIYPTKVEKSSKHKKVEGDGTLLPMEGTKDQKSAENGTKRPRSSSSGKSIESKEHKARKPRKQSRSENCNSTIEQMQIASALDDKDSEKPEMSVVMAEVTTASFGSIDSTRYGGYYKIESFSADGTPLFGLTLSHDIAGEKYTIDRKPVGEQDKVTVTKH